jgi:hypothetical protein
LRAFDEDELVNDTKEVFLFLRHESDTYVEIAF